MLHTIKSEKILKCRIVIESNIRRLTLEDIDVCVELLNKAYRGEESLRGWTSEARILSGKRVDKEAIISVINQQNSVIFGFFNDDKLVAVINAYIAKEAVNFGLFAVEPTLQGQGIGRRLIGFAEKEAVLMWGVKDALMQVISVRKELIDYYKRLGYVLTGESEPLPSSNLWAQTSDSSLELVSMHKTIA